MTIVFKTNVDAYQKNCWPEGLDAIPRIGETVQVNADFFDYYSNKKLPTRMEVVDVTWSKKYVLVELWYKKTDVDAAKISGTNLFQ